MLSESTPNSEERDEIAQILHEAECGCKDYDAHEDEMEDGGFHKLADAVIAAGYRPQAVQHCWNAEGKPFCGDESVKPFFPATVAESNALPICALCHKRSMHFRADGLAERDAEVAELRGKLIASYSAETVLTLRAQLAERDAVIERQRRSAERTLNQDREFLQQVADSYGVRTDEITTGFLRRAAEYREGKQS